MHQGSGKDSRTQRVDLRQRGALRRLGDRLVPVFVLALAGCETLGGIEEIVYVAEPADAGDAAPISCVLPSEGAAYLRVGNFAPMDGRFDFCVVPRDHGVSVRAGAVFAGSGNSCPAGLAYKELSVPFAVPAGTYDLKVVRGDAPDCRGPAVVEVNDIVAQDNRVTSVLVFGHEQEPSGLVGEALAETPGTYNRTSIRFIHGLVGASNLRCGVTDSGRLPATIVSSVFEDVPFASACREGTSDVGRIDENGYLIYSYGGATNKFGVAPPGQTEATVTLASKFAISASYSLFAVGRTGDALFPPGLWSCDEAASEDGILALCGNPLDLAIDIYSPQLTDLFTALFRERKPAVYEAVAAAESDLICLTEVVDPRDIAVIRAASIKQFPYQVHSSSLTPEPSDLTDQNGDEVPAPDGPACAGQASDWLDTLLDCIQEHCTEDDGSGHRFALSGSEAADCVGNFCQLEVGPLILGAPSDKGCWMCALVQMSGDETLEYVRDTCKTDPAARYTFRNGSNVMVLSRYPIGSSKVWRLPATGWNRVAMRVPLDLPNGVPLDFYCASLALPEEGIIFPYVGAYGAGASGPAAWVAEQELQAERLVALVREQSKASGARVVLASTTYAGEGYNEGEREVLVDLHVDTYRTIADAFNLLAAPGYVPACTQCADNPVTAPPSGAVTTAESAWTSLLFSEGIDMKTIRSSEVTFTDPVLEVASPEGAYLVPPSSHYGFRSHVHLTH